ncbi:MAG: pilus assembly protein TadG-related protein [Propionibacteriales bacterium]|nr:pilus assembly protein TadG-related protein [Propionibacteriales bacterium]
MGRRLRARIRHAFAFRSRDESGVVAVFVAVITCFTLIPLSAFAVDIGMQRVARRDAQSVADVVALDLARQLDGRTYAQIMAATPSLATLATRSSARNKAGGDFAVTPELGTLSANYDPANPDAYFVATTTGSVVPTAVRVTATSSVGFTFLSGSGGVSRYAVAKARPIACYRLGSYAATVTSGNSALLNALISDGLNLGVLSYEGLANANVSLLGLKSELGLGTVDQLLNTNLTLNQLYLASASALQKGGGDAADVALLNNLATASFGSLPSVKLGDLLALSSSADAALGATVNLLDLVAGSAFLANGTNALAVPTLTTGIPGVSATSASLKIIEKEQGACEEGADAQTNQVSLDLTFTLVPSNTGLGGLFGLKSGLTTVTVRVALAPATGRLTKAYCTAPQGADITVTSGVMSLTAQVTTDLTLLGIPIARLDSTASTLSPSTSTALQFRVPPYVLGTPKSSGSGTAVPPISVANGDVSLLGVINLGTLVGAITSGLITPLVNPLLANVNSILVGPLATLLGLKLGGADVFLDQLPSCKTVGLTG